MRHAPSVCDATLPEQSFNHITLQSCRLDIQGLYDVMLYVFDIMHERDCLHCLFPAVASSRSDLVIPQQVMLTLYSAQLCWCVWCRSSTRLYIGVLLLKLQQHRYVRALSLGSVEVCKR